MNLWFRFLWTLVVSRFRARAELMARCFTPFRVMPTDLDTLGHVNNGVYLSLQDLARVDFMIRSGTFAVLTRNRWYPVVVSETIQFHRELRPFERFFIETQLIGWDERSFFMRHRFFKHHVKGELCAECIVRGLMVKRAAGPLMMSELLAAVGNPPPPERMPEWIVDWARAMDANRDGYKRQVASLKQ